MRKELVREKLELIYNDDNTVYKALSLLESKLEAFTPLEPKEGLSEKDSMLITYADAVSKDGERPLVTLKTFLDKYVKDSIATVHILPFFPYTSDDGFSVVDYGCVNPDFGDWDDIDAISSEYGLMIDSVANHVSKSSEWFRRYLKCEEPYTDYFITADPEADYSSVTRPRVLPLLTKFETEEGEKYLWTTFSDDQIDLNYRCPELLVDVIMSILDYARHGARFIRLDAIGFIWKELGTTCMHLPGCHEIIKLIRVLLEDYAPGVMLITETNVPQKDNISYFGSGDEAMMVYQFPVPPLVMFTLLSGKSTRLSSWLKTLYKPDGKATYFNFLSSHDGVGLRPADGILTEEEKNYLVESCLRNGGRVSYKNNGDGTQSPYELNIMYLDSLKEEGDSLDTIQKKFLAAMTILLSLQGVPGIYYHSLLGSRNDVKGMNESGMPRRINREKLSYEELSTELDDGESFRGVIFTSLRNMLEKRRKCDAFSPYASQDVLNLDEKVFAVKRRGEEKTVTVLVNVSPAQVEIKEIGIWGKDLIKGKKYNSAFIMEPYETLWIEEE